MAYVVGVEAASRNIKREVFETFAFQVRKHLLEFHRDDARNVLSNDPSGLNLPYDSKHFRPECTVIICAELVPGDTVGLAGESAANKLN